VLGREEGLSTQDLIGHVSLVNVFASWCVPCRAEHPLFMELSATGEVPLYGINYKDPPDQARAWLDELGDPYARIGADINGRAGIEWGVYGVPETYVIAPDGTIAYRHVGPITRAILQETLLPIVRDHKTQSAKEKTP
jgi:cytochrome c biogenesis protein CcmG/thiol:disulfide interchange protein DsbE